MAGGGCLLSPAIPGLHGPEHQGKWLLLSRARQAFLQLSISLMMAWGDLIRLDVTGQENMDSYVGQALERQGRKENACSCLVSNVLRSESKAAQLTHGCKHKGTFPGESTQLLLVTAIGCMIFAGTQHSCNFSPIPSAQADVSLLIVISLGSLVVGAMRLFLQPQCGITRFAALAGSLLCLFPLLPSPPPFLARINPSHLTHKHTQPNCLQSCFLSLLPSCRCCPCCGCSTSCSCDASCSRRK